MGSHLPNSRGHVTYIIWPRLRPLIVLSSFDAPQRNFSLYRVRLSVHNSIQSIYKKNRQLLRHKQQSPLRYAASTASSKATATGSAAGPPSAENYGYGSSALAGSSIARPGEKLYGLVFCNPMAPPRILWFPPILNLFSVSCPTILMGVGHIRLREEVLLAAVKGIELAIEALGMV